MAGHVLISYVRTDQPYVEQLIAQLTAAGLAVVTAPDTFEGQVDAAAVVLAVLTPAGVTQVDREIAIAQQRGRPVLAVVLGGFLPDRLAGSIHEDVPAGSLPSAAFVQRLREFAGAPGGSTPAPVPAPSLPPQPTVTWTPTDPQSQSQAPYPQSQSQPPYPPGQYPVLPGQPGIPGQPVAPGFSPPGPYPMAGGGRATAPSRTGIIVAAVMIVVLVIAGVTTALLVTRSGDDHGIAAPPKSNPPVAQPPALIQPTPSRAVGPGSVACTWSPAPVDRASPSAPPVAAVGTPDLTVPGRGTQVLTLHTNRGPITIQMSLAATPCTAASLAHLANAHFYDNTSCHRLVTDIYALQCGDPSGTGEGGPGYEFADENLPATSPAYHDGDVAMANAGPGTNGSQFFFVYGSDDPLMGNYPLFGHVTAGLDIVKAVGAGGDDEAFAQDAGGGHPLKPLTFTTVTAGPPMP